MRRILATIGDENAHTLSTPALIRWHQSLDISPRAANIALTALSSIYQRSVEWGIVESNPCRGVRRHRETATTVHIPTHSEVARLAMTAPSNRERGMLLVACYAGLRQGELRALTPTDLYHGRIKVSAAIGADGQRKPPKTHEDRVVPIPGSVREWLDEYAHDIRSTYPLFAHDHDPTKPVDKDVWRRGIWYPWVAAADCEHLMWRHLRHYYASTIAAVGASILQCSRWMGHATIVTTMDRYSFLFDQDEARVMDLLERR